MKSPILIGFAFAAIATSAIAQNSLSGSQDINDGCRAQIRKHYGAAPNTGGRTIPGFWDMVTQCVANNGRFIPPAGQQPQTVQQKAPQIPSVPLSSGNQKNTPDARLRNIETVLDQIILPASEKRGDWISRVPSIPVQQQQFCRIVDRFHDDLAKVYLARNELRQSALYRDRHADLAALLPKGRFENWIVRVVEVRQAPDGSGAVLFQPPCRVMFGSDICNVASKKVFGTVAPNTVLYRELEKVSAGDFIVVSGTLIYAAVIQPEIIQAGGASRAVYQTATYCSSNSAGKDQDVFVTEVDYLVQLR